LDALKAYMIMKEGKIPDELTAFFDPQPQVSYVQPLEMHYMSNSFHFLLLPYGLKLIIFVLIYDVIFDTRIILYQCELIINTK